MSDEQIDSASDAELNALLQNIKKGIKAYGGIKNLNSAFYALINSKDGKTEAIDIVLDSVCREFDVSRRILIHSTAKGVLQDARRIACCVLHFELEMPIRVVAKRVFKRKHTRFISVAIEKYRTLSDVVKSDIEYKNAYDNIIKDVKEKIKKQNGKNL